MVPVEFLSDAEVARYGRFVGVPSLEDLERFFFLDDVDLGLIDRRRGDGIRLGFALQLTTARALGVFLSDASDVPAAVIGFLAGQLGIADGSCLDGYLARRTTRFEHAERIRVEYGFHGVR